MTANMKTSEYIDINSTELPIYEDIDELFIDKKYTWTSNYISNDQEWRFYLNLKHLIVYNPSTKIFYYFRFDNSWKTNLKDLSSFQAMIKLIASNKTSEVTICSVDTVIYVSEKKQLKIEISYEFDNYFSTIKDVLHFTEVIDQRMIQLLGLQLENKDLFLDNELLRLTSDNKDLKLTRTNIDKKITESETELIKSQLEETINKNIEMEKSINVLSSLTETLLSQVKTLTEEKESYRNQVIMLSSTQNSNTVTEQTANPVTVQTAESNTVTEKTANPVTVQTAESNTEKLVRNIIVDFN